MSLPKIDVPVYDLILPSDGKKIKIRPFLVKEQKLFLIANESKETAEKLKIIKQVINNCIIEPKLEIDSLAIMDIEFLFLNLRARSIGEIVDVDFQCQNEVEDGTDEYGIGLSTQYRKKCGQTVTLKFNLLDAEIENIEEARKKRRVELTPTVGLNMRFPDFEATQTLVNGENVDDVDLVVNCIEYIYDENNIYYKKDLSKEEIVEWLENLSHQSYEKLEDFFKSIPKVRLKNNFKCTKCGHEEPVVLEGIESFFG